MGIKIIGSIIFLLILFSVRVKAQEKDSLRTYHFAGLQFGVNQVKDENLHTKVSTGTITELTYGFERRIKTWQQFHFTLSYSRLKTNFEDLSKSVNLQLKLDYSKTFSLVHKNNFNYYLGPEVAIDYDACYFPNWDDSHLYWADYLSIGVRNNFSVQLKNQNEWVSSISIPLFSVFSRPELYRLYKIDDTDVDGIAHNLNSNITPAHLVNVFYLNFQTEYRFPVFRNKKEAFIYSFEWLRVKHNDGNPFSQITHLFGIKLFL